MDQCHEYVWDTSTSRFHQMHEGQPLCGALITPGEPTEEQADEMARLSVEVPGAMGRRWGCPDCASVSELDDDLAE